ncbi:NAD(P)-dependent alcohol dehydrogenase [Parvularcula maris]|uniref:NAD(P)-dependent alcohol dehydrogenase n=1 Tax=Parvularcula maris TaxID=2965077 RepID=UPI00273BA4D7|nr:NAD(P)-dependent alcohol dehydrogenase [Parvularcula maris]
MHVIGYGTTEASAELVPLSFERPDMRAGEVEIEITHCGVCHSDLHQARDDWGNTVWPCVPGHEVVGLVTRVGDGVTKFKEGDRVGVGCMVNSCQACGPCEQGDEQYCEGPKSATLTYNGPKKPDGSNTYGGYSTGIVVREEFVLHIPEAIDPAEAAPILCAGITTYNPMKHFGLKEGQTLGVAGIGGLGHMAVQLGKSFGAKVVALTTTEAKRSDILELGADEVVVMSDEEAVKNAAQSLDLMIDTIPYPHDLNDYIPLMKPNTTLCVVGNIIEFPSFDPAQMIFNRVAVSGSLIGGVAMTQEVLDRCAEHGIRPLIEKIDIDEVSSAFGRMQEEDVRFRHVIDMAGLKSRMNDVDAKKIDPPARGEVVGR